MTKNLAVFVGFIGKIPYAGMSLYNLHHIVGLRELGYDVHYVEVVDYPSQCYDPSTDTMTSDPSYALRYLGELLPKYGVGPNQFSFVDLDRVCHGSGWPLLREALDRADFVLTVGTPSWFDELARCPRRMFVDIDPVFTQAEMIDRGLKASVLRNYDILCTYGTRIGEPGCTIPSADRSWIPTRTPIATKLWTVAPPPATGARVTALLHWAAGKDAIVNGQAYGHKNREFQRFMELPMDSTQPFAAAIGGNPPRQQLSDLGWNLLAPLEATGTIAAYEKFIRDSRADFGVAKHAYVASRSGWFSDRSTCFLASGRPVLHQDTGFGAWLPTGEGVFPFNEPEDVMEVLRQLDLDYDAHARAARRLAEDHFEARSVLGRMLGTAGFR